MDRWRRRPLGPPRPLVRAGVQCAAPASPHAALRATAERALRRAAANTNCSVLAMHPSHGGSGDNSDLSGSWVSWDKPDDGPYVAQLTFTATKVY